MSHENEKGLTKHVDLFDRYVIHHQFREVIQESIWKQY